MPGIDVTIPLRSRCSWPSNEGERRRAIESALALAIGRLQNEVEPALSLIASPAAAGTTPRATSGPPTSVTAPVPVARPPSTSGAARPPVVTGTLTQRLDAAFAVGQARGREDRRLRAAFHLTSVTSSDVSAISSAYRQARSILNEVTSSPPMTTIRLYSGRDNRPELWGEAPIDRWERTNDPQDQDVIEVGPAFFAPPSGDGILGAVTAACPRRTNRLELARAATLVEEAVHWVIGRGGHASVGLLNNPVSYWCYFLLQAGDSISPCQATNR